jgi:hypothetical protein
MLDVLRVDIFPEIAALFYFMQLALELRLHDLRVVTFLLVINVGLLLLLLVLMQILQVHFVT